MTLDEFIQREIDSGRIEDAECFYIGLDTFKLDNGTELNVNDYAKYLDYDLKKVVITINFPRWRGGMLYDVELRADVDKE